MPSHRRSGPPAAPGASPARPRPVDPFRRALVHGAAGAAIAALAPSSRAQAAWPSKPIRLIVPLAVGSTADIASRAVGTELAAALGQPVVVENKPGAGGTIAMAELARSAPDGHTIGFASQGTLVFNQALYSKPGYDSTRDFAPVALLGGVSNVMIVHPSNPARTVADVIAQAKARPGQLMFSSGGSGTSHHLSGVLFAQSTGTELVHVPYKGAPQGILAVMSNEIQLGFFNTPTVINQIREGRLKALAVTSERRSPLLPQVPTMIEAGVRNYVVDTWFGFVAPARTPPAAITRLHEEVARALTAPAMREKLTSQGFDLASASSPDAMSTLLRADLEKWIPIVKASGAQVD